MKNLWAARGSTDWSMRARDQSLSNSLLIAAGASTLAAICYLLLQAILPNSIYLLAALALLASAYFGGGWAALTTTIVLGIACFLIEGGGPLPPAERAARAGLFGLLGLGMTVGCTLLEGQRRKAVDSLRRHRSREALLEASLDAIGDAVIVFDDQGAIHSFSRTAERLFGWPAAEARTAPVSRFLPPDPEGLEGAPKRVVAGDIDGTGSYRQALGRRRDGTEFPMDARIVEIGDGTGRLFAAVLRDLTTERDAERRSEALHAQLSQVWSLNSMGEMASVLAHELNQPLSAVANYLRAARTLIARMELDNDDLLEAVSRAGDQAVRAGEIIRTMRDLAQRGGLEQKPESMSGIIREVDFLVALMARDADVRVGYDFYKGDDTVIADRIQIQQLVVNLVRNAIEAVTRYPSRQLSISTYLDSEGNIVTTVEDSGPGIEPSVAERLFQPLASTKPQGMGLGLSISSAIVENHRGRIWAEPSRLGGAAFCFVLARAGQHGADFSRRTDGVRR